MSIYLAMTMVYPVTLGSALLMNNNECYVFCSRDLHFCCELY